MSWTKCKRLTSEPREILTSQQGINQLPMAVIHNLRNQVVMVGMPPLDPVVRTVTTENTTIIKHLMTVGMTIGAMAPEIPVDICLGTIARIGTIQVNPAMTHRHLIILIYLKGLTPRLWKPRH